MLVPIWPIYTDAASGELGDLDACHQCLLASCAMQCFHGAKCNADALADRATCMSKHAMHVLIWQTLQAAFDREGQ